MIYLLDTHVWIWMNSAPEEISRSCRRILNSASDKDQFLLSAISLWELCKLVEKKKINLFEDLEAWVDFALDHPRLSVAPLDFKVFLRSTTLPGTFHNDPADQLIVATARLYNATLISKDQRLWNYPHVRSVW